MAKIIDAPHKIIGVTLMPTGRLILATENRIYDLVNNVWEAMAFAPDPEPDPTPEPPAETPAEPTTESQT